MSVYKDYTGTCLLFFQASTVGRVLLGTPILKNHPALNSKPISRKKRLKKFTSIQNWFLLLQHALKNPIKIWLFVKSFELHVGSKQ